ncbi:MAG: MSCRAMM family protein, partial [Mycobacteriales bacterium]
NSVPRSDLGTATSANNYFRQIGGSLGAAAAGTLFSHRLADQLSGKMPSGVGAKLPSVNAITPQLVHSLPEPMRRIFVSAFAEALPPIFLYLAPLLVVGFVAALFIKEKALDSHAPAAVPAAPVTQATSPVPAPAPPPMGELDSLVLTEVPTGYLVRGWVRMASGAAVGDASLTLIDQGGRQVGRGFTGGDGAYGIYAPAPGTYMLIARARSHQPRATTVVAGTEDRSTVDITLTGASGLTGTVRTTNGGQPLTSATVSLADECGAVVSSQSTDGQGAYAFEEIIAGNYTLAVQARGFQPWAGSAHIGDGEITHRHIELAGNAQLEGVALAGNPRRPLADAQVSLVDSGGSVLAVTVTGADGVYRFPDIPEGRYTLVATGYPPVKASVDVVSGELRMHDIELQHSTRADDHATKTV